MRRLRPGVLLAGLCGGGYGLALARALFETQPQTFGLFNTWPGAFTVAAVGALAGAGLISLSRASAWAALPLTLTLVGLLPAEVNINRAWTLLAGSLGLFLVLATDSAGSVAARLRSSLLRFSSLPHALLFVCLLTIYALTLSPTVGEADPFEFQVNVAQLSIAHGNGYPLLILVGKLFELLPLGGTPAWRVNASAAVAAALAAVGVSVLARKLGAAARFGFLAAFAFGVAPSVWVRAVEIEAYALNAALLTVLLALGLRLIQGTQASRFTFYALAFVFGLSLTNHLTAILLAPALAWAAGLRLWRRLRTEAHDPRTRRSARRAVFHNFLLAGFFFLLGLSVYLYLPLRWPALHNGEALSVQQFIYFLRGGEAAGQFNAWLPLQEPQRFEYVFRKIIGEFGWAGAALMLTGAAALWLGGEKENEETGKTASSPSLPSESRWPEAVFLLLAYVGHVYFVLAYDPPEPDFSDFFIATYVVAAIFIALGLHALTLQVARVLQSCLHTPGSKLDALPYFLLPSAFLLLPLSSIWSLWPRFDHAAAQQRFELGRYTLSQPLAARAAILADPKRFAALYYLQKAEGMRPDLDIMVLPDEVSYRAALEERLAAGQAVYLARYLPGLGSAYSLRSVGPLAEVSPQPFTSPPTNLRPLDVVLAAGIQLAGYESNATSNASRLTLHWHAPETPQANLAVYLRLRSSSGVLWQSAGQIPVSGLYPTNAWRPSEYVSDFYEIAHQLYWPPGRYTLEAGLFPPFQPQAQAGWGAVTVLDIGLPATPPRPSRLLRAQFGDQWLFGYDKPETALPGSPTPVTLYWLRGDSDSVTAFGETRSLAAWPSGSIAPLSYRLQSPVADPQFSPVVETGRAARCGWLAAESTGCALPPIRLVGAALPADAVNFNGQLVLRQARLETPQVERGGLVRVNLEWQALQTMRESYTVFVHLVGPDGRLYGQRDYWPVEGTRLTTSWQPGEIIRDPYEVRLWPEAPTGDYTVHIGLYLLETLQRLPVLNADSLPLDDKLVLTGLAVR